MDLKDFNDVILKCNLFKHLTEKDLCNLFLSIDHKIVHIDKDVLIHKRGETCDNLIIILEGTLSLNQRNYNNKSFNIYNFCDSEIVGANSIFAHNPKYKVDIYTKSPCVLLYIPQHEVFNLCVNDSVFLRSFLMHLSDKTQKLLDKIKIFSNKNIRSSIKQFLSCEFKKQNSTKINLEMSKKELAELLGVERTSLSRELKSMKLDGLIDYDKNSITILSPKEFI